MTNPVTGQNVLYGKQEQLSFTATAKLTRYWSVQGTETINLTNSTNLVNGVATPQSSSTSLYASLSAIYQDECMAFVGALTQSGIRNGAVTPGVRCCSAWCSRISARSAAPSPRSPAAGFRWLRCPRPGFRLAATDRQKDNPLHQVRRGQMRVGDSAAREV